METKKCKVCGRELPITEFRMTRWGHYTEVCNKCSTEKYIKTRNKNKNLERQNISYSDPEFDSKQPVEVLQLMKRAKIWLEAQGYNITLKGTYTQIRKVKF